MGKKGETMNCHYCQEHIPWSDKGNTDNEGNRYHYECGQHLQSNNERQEQEAEEVKLLSVSEIKDY